MSSLRTFWGKSLASTTWDTGMGPCGPIYEIRVPLTVTGGTTIRNCKLSGPSHMLASSPVPWTDAIPLLPANQRPICLCLLSPCQLTYNKAFSYFKNQYHSNRHPALPLSHRHSYDWFSKTPDPLPAPIVSVSTNTADGWNLPFRGHRHLTRGRGDLTERL